MNGAAYGACDASALLPGETCDGATCGSFQQLVKPNTKYRLRVINAAGLSYIQLALEGHSMTLFEADVREPSDVSLW